MTPADEKALMLAIVQIGSKVVALEADPRLWKTNDQLALCRDLWALTQRLDEKIRNQKSNDVQRMKRASK